jgi:hypothetical protein
MLDGQDLYPMAGLEPGGFGIPFSPFPAGHQALIIVPAKYRCFPNP